MGDADDPTPNSDPATRTSILDNAWLQLVTGIVAMVAIANLQYGWTLFVVPIKNRFPGWAEADIQWAFTLFVLAETWLVPLEGYLVDRYGARLFVGIGGLLVGLAWTLNSWADSLAAFYLAGIIGGAGAGVVYGTSIGSALKWFPHRRGLAAGLTSAAFGAGSALTVKPIDSMIKEQGYQDAFLYFGIGQGIVVLVCALLMRSPPAGAPAQASVKVQQTSRDFTWQEMLCSPAFWLMYVMFTMAATGGLMAVAQLGPMARDYHVAQEPVVFLGMVVGSALVVAMSLDRILNGLTRPFFGWISDHLGRENTMFLAFGLEGVAILVLLTFAHIPIMFVLLTGLVFFAWGEIYSLFPALCGDLFGRKYATTNYGLLYTAKGTAALLVPLGSKLAASTGKWEPIFYVAVAFDWTAALLALLVLKSLRTRWLARAAEVVEPAEGSRAPA